MGQASAGAGHHGGKNAAIFSHPKTQSDQRHDGKNNQRRPTPNSKTIVASRHTELDKTIQKHVVTDHHDIVADATRHLAGKPSYN